MDKTIKAGVNTVYLPVEWKYLRQHPICQILVVFL
ncbi:hypothetical protein PIIN_10702 [Serendipita indica DSM 11827]|uniref:Uncharacterized protein n=1 Tax=Serendipita indica (strain DSM 11827) TaxID=1109443 RepID=G4TZH1_SERID|nr:hypothetical protein PIIN_10702 [Serendipita indica DSM 11827]